MREATPCLNWEHLTQRVATLEDTLLQTIQRRPMTSAPAAEDLQKVLTDTLLQTIRRRQMTAGDFQKALEAAREQVRKAATTRVPDTKHAWNLPKRSGQHGEAYFRFLTPPPHRPDEPSGRTGDWFRGDRPAHPPTDAQ